MRDWKNMERLVGLLLLALIAGPAWAQESSPSPSRPGLSQSQNPIDPSENVKALSEAANKRQDDLRVATEKLFQFQLQAAEKISELRYQHAQELAQAQAQKLEDEAKLRAEYAERLAIAEAKRIDAIRAVDVNAVAVSSQRTTEQATALQTQTTASAEVLRNQVARSAEDLRALVATTAATALQNQQQQFAGISTRITTLEQAQSEGKGKQTLQDPAFLSLLADVRRLTESKSAVTGASEGQGQLIAWGFAAIMALFAGAGFIRNMMAKQK